LGICHKINQLLADRELLEKRQRGYRAMGYRLAGEQSICP
jgi:hypothetical protein